MVAPVVCFKRPRKDKCGFDLISNALPFGRLRYGLSNGASNAVDCAKLYSRSRNAAIRVYDEAANVIKRTSMLVMSQSRKELSQKWLETIEA